MMELFQTNDHFIFQNGENSLWCCRKSGEIEMKRGSEVALAWNPVCLGIVYGIIGKIQLHPDLDKKLLFIRQQSLVGTLPGSHRVYKINKIGILTLNSCDPPDLCIEPCKKHHFGIKKSNKIGASPENQRKPLQKTWNTIKTATAQATSQVKSRKVKKEIRDRERFEKRVTDELYKMFNDTDSFYYSPTGDLTNCMQRQYVQAHSSKADLPLWQRVDDRFFWNKHMLQDLTDSHDPIADHWILPVIQGCVEIYECSLEDHELGPLSQSREALNVDKYTREYKMILISRRSRHRAGTRYKRRGVDESGQCANYVETEQIIEYLHHCLSFNQVRGSVPVFWCQPGYKYRPPPRLDRGEEETQIAFENHFANELAIYEQIAIINLVEQTGREKVLSDAYISHVINYNNPNLIYVSFDFHEYCRGMRFENVSILINNIDDIIKNMWYCWIDKQGLICKQQGIFRINCIDCLDRTNIVQTALAKAVLENQFTKLGLLPPEGTLPSSCRNIFQIMWANNGDIISRQYAGTAALKGDFTRTGERRLAGMMKDGYNSANRYFLNSFRDGYRQACVDIMQGKAPEVKDLSQIGDKILDPLSLLLPERPLSYFNDLALSTEINFVTAVFGLSRYYMNRFKDAYRQATIDLMLGNPVSEDVLNLSPDRENVPEDDAAWLACQAEHVKQLIDDCKKILVPNADVVLGGWALVDADPVSGDPAQQDMDTVLILTNDSYYIAEYDDEADRITRYQRVMLEDVEKIEIGPEPSLFKSRFICIRMNYCICGHPGYFHMFRSPNTRFFNNMAVPIKSEEEAIESLKAIVETFAATIQMEGLQVPVYHGKLERRKSKMPYVQNRMSPLSTINLELPSFGGLPRNVSEGQLTALKTAGTKAINNMTSQIAKLNPMNLKLRNKDKNIKTLEKMENNLIANHNEQDVSVSPNSESQLYTKPNFAMESGSSEEEEEELRNKENGNNESEPTTARDLVLSSCGIVAASPGQTAELYFVEDHFANENDINGRVECESFSLEAVKKATDEQQQTTLGSVDAQVESHQTQQQLIISDSEQSPNFSPRPLTPEITISREDSMEGLSQQATAPVSPVPIGSGGSSGGGSPRPSLESPLPPVKKFSHSSEELGTSPIISNNNNIPPGVNLGNRSGSLGVRELRRGSEQRAETVVSGIKTSHSEGAIGHQQHHAHHHHAIGGLARDIVVPGFSKLARGMQNLSANLGGLVVMRSPVGAPSSGNVSHSQNQIGYVEDALQRRLRERKSTCLTRIIEL